VEVGGGEEVWRDRVGVVERSGGYRELDRVWKGGVGVEIVGG